MIPTPAASPWWQRTWLLAAVLFIAILLNNSEPIFHSRIYEHDDYAANSLQILKAKQFHETLGHYCRFQFHHPGPAFFYLFGWGELIFFDALKLVPTPFNAQLIALFAFSTFFFSAALMIVARHLPRGRNWFLGLSLLLAAWHFGNVGKFYNFIPGELGLFCIWPPCLLVFPFLCFLVASASVASGRARDLPLLVLPACFLVHGHAAMPLFVVPLTIVAYTALILQCKKTPAKWPWRCAPVPHFLAAGIIALFLLPMAVDVATAHPNNLQRIVRHLQSSYGDGKSALQSVLYFLHFGAYSPYPSTNSIPAFETFDWPGTTSFFIKHWRAYGIWIVVLALCLVLAKRQPPIDEPERKFRRRFVLMLCAAVALSIVWGCIQEGSMYYYNSLFNFAIYYALLVFFAVVCARWFEQRAAGWPRRIIIAAGVVLVVGVIAGFVQKARYFRSATPDQTEQTQFANAIEQALKLDPVEPKFVNFDWQGGGQTTRIALYLERRGVRWWVREDWPLYFGEEHIIREGKPGQPVPSRESSFWRIVWHPNLPAQTVAPSATVIPLTRDYDLVVTPGKTDARR